MVVVLVLRVTFYFFWFPRGLCFSFFLRAPCTITSSGCSDIRIVSPTLIFGGLLSFELDFNRSWGIPGRVIVRIIFIAGLKL